MIKATDDIDRKLAAEALRKRQRGEQPTTAEQSALRRVEKARDYEERWRHYRQCPKGDYATMSGRQIKVLNEQAVRHGLPIGGPIVDLTAVIKALHQILADNAHVLGNAKAAAKNQRQTAEDRKSLAEAELAEIKAARAKDSLFEPFRRLVIQHVNSAKAVLDQIPDRTVAKLPAKTAAKIRNQVRRDVFRIIDTACEMLADMKDGPPSETRRRKRRTKEGAE